MVVLRLRAKFFRAREQPCREPFRVVRGIRDPFAEARAHVARGGAVPHITKQSVHNTPFSFSADGSSEKDFN
jgi:hypothetical protein